MALPLPKPALVPNPPPPPPHVFTLPVGEGVGISSWYCLKRARSAPWCWVALSPPALLYTEVLSGRNYCRCSCYRVSDVLCFSCVNVRRLVTFGFEFLCRFLVNVNFFVVDFFLKGIVSKRGHRTVFSNTEIKAVSSF